MRVRCWAIVGPRPLGWAGSLAPVDPIPQFFGVPPDATNYMPGTVIEWQTAPEGPFVVLVCIETSIA
jgi:hypothetical protein